MNDTNGGYYNKYIVKDKVSNLVNVTSKSNELLMNCYKYYKSAIKNTCTDKSAGLMDIIVLLDYFKYICKNIVVVEILVLDYSNPYVIFETSMIER
ncbi:hypothetical protein P8V03_18840 [Clostridium sp. A1-XYC3]|uniref:Uncharacterized protein n=1 Tax=Clostridium tanneri TaxID=3037988 RepID=A0ABU4JYD6_9CLOT|nr:hypothetical protein [Clostridium sp. A1-XYC3]MDW8803188.1 hypothetical protein [Clostridium sp. A1-XYC3]